MTIYIIVSTFPGRYTPTGVGTIHANYIPTRRNPGMEPMPESLRQKLANAAKSVSEIMPEPAGGESWADYELRVDKILAGIADSKYCRTCTDRPVYSRRTGECHRCQEFRRRTGRSWEPTTGRTCITGCEKPAVTRHKDDGMNIWLCRMHKRRLVRRGPRYWRCSNHGCPHMPRKNEIYCRGCIAAGRTS